MNGTFHSTDGLLVLLETCTANRSVKVNEHSCMVGREIVVIQSMEALDQSKPLTLGIRRHEDALHATFGARTVRHVVTANLMWVWGTAHEYS
jgi:hypothetical protein